MQCKNFSVYEWYQHQFSQTGWRFDWWGRSDKKIAKTILEGLSKEQKKHNKKDTMIRIAGVVSLVIIAALGTFFVNPDGVLLGEIVDLIKSLQ